MKRIRLFAGAVVALLAVGAFVLGHSLSKTHHVYDGAEMVYTDHYPSISNHATASDVLRHFNNTPLKKSTVSVAGGPAHWPTRQWSWSDHKTWQVTVVWFAGPEEPQA